ncbi:DedA family protein [Paractinoplanes rhizophilus]|uniref:DedA family protein n=1 Tax=Paractinoplanes rhizophilus TaxID=1416877 RepID=A0ABW2HU70_9ACTN|nr:VTT domain-containing protein [Actinoplanes sp.]
MLNHLLPLISSPWLYVIIFLLVAVDGFVPVAMSEAVIIGVAALSTAGSPDLTVLAAAAVAGGMAGDRISYYAGRKAGARIRNGKLATAKAKAEQAFVRQGSAALVIGRFIPYGRTATTLTAGSVSLPMRPFYLASAVSSLLWAAYSIGLGRLGGATFADSPLLAAAFGIALGFLLAGLHGAVKRLGSLLAPILRRARFPAGRRPVLAPALFRARRRPAPAPAVDDIDALEPGLVETG